MISKERQKRGLCFYSWEKAAAVLTEKRKRKRKAKIMRGICIFFMYSAF
jgi:hypothetical protein